MLVEQLLLICFDFGMKLIAITILMSVNTLHLHVMEQCYDRPLQFSQKLTEQCPATYAVHCHAHCLTLACTDTVKELQHIQDCERGLVPTWKYFSRSPLKTAKLHKIQAGDVDSSKRKLVKACLIRWLSHGEAIKAIKAELSDVYTALNYFASTKRLHSSEYSSLNFYKALFVFPLLTVYCFRVSKQVIITFSKRKLLFFSQSALAFYKKEIRNIADSDQVINSLKLDWEKMSKILPATQMDLYG